jgi:hypothetical protein
MWLSEPGWLASEEILPSTPAAAAAMVAVAAHLVLARAAKEVRAMLWALE